VLEADWTYQRRLRHTRSRVDRIMSDVPGGVSTAATGPCQFGLCLRALVRTPERCLMNDVFDYNG
jgi:hypothetical protein